MLPMGGTHTDVWGSEAGSIAYAGRATWCGNARGALPCGGVVLMTVEHSRPGGSLMSRAGTIWAAPAARLRGYPQCQDHLRRRGSVWDRAHQGHTSASRHVDRGGAEAGHRRRWPPPVMPSPNYRDADVREEGCTMSTSKAQSKFQVAFAGAFAVRLEQPVRAHLRLPCDVLLDDEVGMVSRLADVD